MKNFGISGMAGYKLYKKQLALMNYPYTEIHKGTTISIECDGKRWQFKKGDDHRAMVFKGFHLCRLVKDNVLRNLENIPKFNAKKINALIPVEELFNPVNMVKNTKKDMYSIDVDDCYWHTIYKLGYIDFALFVSGLRKKQWKDGRNASIGSLAAKEKIYKFIGNEQKGEVKIIDPDERLTAVRNHVIYTVWELFKNIIKEIQGEFLMFFKDCVYVSSMDAKEKAIEIIRGEGYKCKIRHHYLLSFDGKNNIPTWYCYEDRTSGIKKNKYYYFINEQSIFNVL